MLVQRQHNTYGIAMILGLAITLSMVVTSTASAFGANPWTTEVGDARAVQSKTEDISERLRDKFPFCPATSVSLRLDQTANQLESHVENGSPWSQVQMSLRQTSALAAQVHRLAAGDHHVRSDNRTMNYFGELNKRLAKLDTELQKSYAKQTIVVCPPVRGPLPSHVHQPGHVHQHSAGYPVFEDTYNDWNNPFHPAPSYPRSSNGSPFPRSNSGPHIDIQIDPPGRRTFPGPEVVPPIRTLPAHPLPPTRSNLPRSAPPKAQPGMGRQILSHALREVADQL